MLSGFVLCKHIMTAPPKHKMLQWDSRVKKTCEFVLDKSQRGLVINKFLTTLEFVSFWLGWGSRNYESMMMMMMMMVIVHHEHRPRQMRVVRRVVWTLLTCRGFERTHVYVRWLKDIFTVGYVKCLFWPEQRPCCITWVADVSSIVPGSCGHKWTVSYWYGIPVFVINYIGSFRGFLGFPFMFDIFAYIGLMLEARVGIYTYIHISIYHIHIHIYTYLHTFTMLLSCCGLCKALPFVLQLL